MASKVRRISINIDDEKWAYLTGKASEYGIPFTKLVLRAMEAYTRVYDGEGEPPALVAVNYGVWTRTMVSLVGIEQAMRECAQQVAGLRRLLSSLAQTGAIAHTDAARAESILLSCLTEIRESRKRIATGIEVLESLHEAVCVTDFCVMSQRGDSRKKRQKG